MKTYNEWIEQNNNLYHQRLLNDHRSILAVVLNDKIDVWLTSSEIMTLPRSFNDNKHSFSINVRYKCPGIGFPTIHSHSIRLKKQSI